MERREFLTVSSAAALGSLPLLSRTSSRKSKQPPELSADASGRPLVLVPAGSTRQPDGTTAASTSQQQTVVRSFDSEGRLAAFVVPVGEHTPYRGAPLHLHHEQDEWVHILAGEFVAEVGGKRMRLKPGDSLLMPMKIPHRWSIAGQSHGGAIHLYVPAGLMDASWDSHADAETPQSPDQRKAWFEKYGMSLLGGSLTKEEIDSTV
jgi:mannose-6-phosphate isomerase-like protein (cupin superfamily)